MAGPDDHLRKTMMPYLYLHIGLPKTGTSALQVFFARNAVLLHEHGIRYPWARGSVGKSNRITSGNAARLARFGLSDQDPEGKGRLAVDALSQVLSKGRRSILLSSEYFSTWHEERFAELRAMARSAGFEPKVIVYLKDQADIAVTHYFQMLKRRPGFGKTADAQFDTFISTYIEQPFLDFEKMLDMIADVVGIDNVVVRSTKPERLTRSSLMCDFLDALGLEDFGAFDLDIPRVNPTPRQHEMVIRAALNPFDPTVSFSDAYLDVVNAVYADVGLRPVDSQNYMVDPQIIAGVRDRFRASNERVCRQWFHGASPADAWSEQEYRELVEFDESSDLRSAIAVLGGLLVRAWKRIEALEDIAESHDRRTGA